MNMNKTIYNLVWGLALCAGLLVSGCQKEDNISPINYNIEVENDNTLVGTSWYFSNSDKIVNSETAYAMLSKIDFEEINKGSFTFSTDPTNINSHRPMSYILHSGEGCLLLQNREEGTDTLRFILLDDYHMKVTLTPATAGANPTIVNNMFNTDGDTMEAVYCRLEADKTSPLCGSKWNTVYTNGLQLGNYYNGFTYIARIVFDAEGGGIMISGYHGSKEGHLEEPPYDSLRRPFILNDNGDELQLLFYNGDTAFLHRGIVNHDTVLLLTPTVCAIGLTKEHAYKIDRMTAEGAKKIWFNRPEDLLDDRGYGLFTIDPSPRANLFLLKRTVSTISGSICFVIHGNTTPNGNVTHFIYLWLNSELVPGSYAIGEDRTVYYSGLDEGTVTSGTLDVIQVNGGYRLDLKGVNEFNDSVWFSYQGHLNDYETLEE